MYITSRPQKLLIGLSTVVFVLGLVPFLLAITGSIADFLPKPITVVNSSALPVNAQNQELSKGANFDEVIFQPSGNSILQGAGNTIVMTPQAKVQVGSKFIKVEAGIVFLQISQATTLNVGDAQLELNSVSGILDAAKGIFIITDGQATVGSDVASVNKVVNLGSGGNAVADFDRAQFSSDSNYSQLLAYLQTQNLASASIQDLTPPELTALEPASNTATQTDSIDISGQTEANIAVKINDQQITSDVEGKFTARLPLALGANAFTIILTDKNGNYSQLTYNITRDEIVACQTGAFKADLICQINRYRQQNGLGTLSEDVRLSTAASDHSDWMASTGSLTHSGLNGSSPWDRCSSAGTTCDAENLAVNTSATALNIFNQWKNSADHNATMLGAHSAIGIGITSGYVTGVFR